MHMKRNHFSSSEGEGHPATLSSLLSNYIEIRAQEKAAAIHQGE